ncbi:BppU family phage baseplate upper protein [Rossellomorea marisflavi]|uniref:BppU family phage baseplate upper protein n=1 Tax=Rossellomorea marisflavi TaxID=189381 RepID=UPI003D2ECCEE
MEVTSKRRITVDIRKNNKVAIPSFVQGDTNVVEFEILDNGVAADLSTVGKVVANYKRPDKHVVTREPTYAGNIVSYRMGQEEMEVAGLGEVEVQFFNADYSKRLSTFAVRVNVAQSVGEAAELSDELGNTLLQDLLVKGDYAEEQAKQAEAAAKTALTNWLSPVANKAAVDAIAGPKLGDTVQTNDNGFVYRYDGSKWVKTQEYGATALANVNAQLAEKASKQDIANIGNASPKGTYANLTALQTAFPSGTTGIFVVQSDGKWYYWSGVAWTAGGVYQSAGIALESVSVGMTDFFQEINFNVLNKQVIKEKGFWSTTGSWVSRDDIFSIEGFIPVNEGDRYYHNAYSFYKYDVNREYLGQTTSGGTINPYFPESNVRYLRPNFKYATTSIQGAYVRIDGNNEGFKGESLVISEKNLEESLSRKINDVKKNSKKFMHISADDVIGLFEDLTLNKDLYSSIFENPVLGFLKALHDDYGMVFSGYCFYQNSINNPSFNLSQCTGAFSEEFEANSEWLKFGFHARMNATYENSTASKAKEDYDLVMSELFRILGGGDSLDRVPRVHGYSGNLMSVEAWRDTNVFSVIGLLSAEDTRTSYYHSTYQRDFLQTHDRLIDHPNRMTFLSTDIRLESTENVTIELNSRKSNVAYGNKMDGLIVFTHEYLLSDPTVKSKIVACCDFARSNGYSFDFPMYRL